MELFMTLLILLLIAAFSKAIGEIYKDNMWKYIQGKLEFEKAKDNLKEKVRNGKKG